MATIALADNDELWNGRPGDLVVGALFLLGVISIVHAFAVRRTYIAQRQAVLEGGRPVTAPPARHRTARGVAVVAVYLVLGLIGGVVVLVALFSDPCLPFYVADESGYARGRIMDAIVITRLCAYLALIVPMTLAWRTNRVWWVVLGGGVAVGALSVFAEWLTIALTGPPAYCNC